MQTRLFFQKDIDDFNWANTKVFFPGLDEERRTYMTGLSVLDRREGMKRRASP
jgi:hypothetical protein